LQGVSGKTAIGLAPPTVRLNSLLKNSILLSLLGGAAVYRCDIWPAFNDGFGRCGQTASHELVFQQTVKPHPSKQVPTGPLPWVDLRGLAVAVRVYTEPFPAIISVRAPSAPERQDYGFPSSRFCPQ
jgi:hypothetical protein